MKEKMKNKIMFSTVLVGQLLLTACATTEPTGAYRSSVISNINSAPSQMSPPENIDSNIDPTYVRTQADYHYALGEALSMDGQTEKAIEEFKLTALYDAESPTVRLRLASEYLKQGLMTEAVEQAEAGLKVDPKNEEIHQFLGGVYTTLKMYAEATKEYEAVLVSNPKNYDIPLYLGAVKAEQNQLNEAERYFLKATVDPEYERAHLAHYYIGRMRSIAGEDGYARAEKAYKEALRLKPDFEDGVAALAELYEMRNQKEKGIALLESFQTNYGPKKMIAFTLGQYYLEQEKYDKAFKHLLVLESFEPQNLNVKMKLALILIEQKNYDAAVEKLEEILSLSPNSDKPRFYVAAIHEETKNYKQAIYHFKKIEPSSTYFAESTVHVAYMYKQQNQLNEAIETMERAITEREDIPNFYAFYASLLDEKKDYARGVKVLAKASEKFPKSAQLHFYLGSMLDRVGKVEESIVQMRETLAIDKDHVQALNFIAFTYADMNKNLVEAEEMALRALELQPNDPYIMDTVGWVHFKAGRTEEAIRYLEAAQGLKPDEAILAEHLGDAYYVFELADKAREMYLKAVAVETDAKKLATLRNKIVSMDKNQNGRVPASVQDKSNDRAR